MPNLYIVYMETWKELKQLGDTWLRQNEYTIYSA